MFKSFKSKKTIPEVAWQRRAIREGRGTGRGARYESFIRVKRSDFASHGVSHILPNPQLGRRHHFLSELEYHLGMHFLHLGAADAREQLFLRMQDDDQEFHSDHTVASGTLTLGTTLGISHPAITSLEPRALTTDLVITDVKGRHRAVFARYVKDLPPPGSRQEELLNLQNFYWQHRSVPFYVLTELDLDPKQTDVLTWALDGFLDPANALQPGFLDYLSSRDPWDSLDAVLARWGGCDKKALLQFKLAVFTGLLRIPLKFKKLPTLADPWGFMLVPEQEHERRLEDFFAGKEARHV